MNSVKSVIINFESMTDNRKRDIMLYGDSRFDENKKKKYFASNHKLFEKF